MAESVGSLSWEDEGWGLYRRAMMYMILLMACSPCEPLDLPTVPEEEQQSTLRAMAPPKREIPVIAVLAANEGTETTDMLVPYSVLARSGVAEVYALSTESGPVQLMPALTVQLPHTLAWFDQQYPDGADYVIVPALHHPDDPAVLDWVRRQSEGGATIVSICSGARVLSEAGLLEGRAATGHWYDLDYLQRKNPTMEWVPDRRYVADRGVVTTTGVTASIPVSLALIEAIAGRGQAALVAAELGVESWGPEHDSDAFLHGEPYAWTVVRNQVAFWGHDTFALPIESGVDEVALALTADAYSRTYRSRAQTAAETLEPLTTREGLTLLPDLVLSELKRELELELGEGAQVLDEALLDLEARYDRKTASWVARQVEYPGWSCDE
jgi:putative intracellular protease/amidase